MKFTLTEDHINFILNDIESRGVKMESLQQGLVDHICCILEEEITEEKDFEYRYEEVVKRFFKNQLSEIEEETEQLLRNKYYYQMKKFLYILLFVSLAFNLYVITRITLEYLAQKREMSESSITPGISLKDAIPFLIDKIKEEYPGKEVNKKIYVGFLTNQFEPRFELDSSMAQFQEISVDSVRKAQKMASDEKYARIDSLAGAHPDVTFVIAFARTASDVDECISEYKQKTKHLLFLKGMQKLNSGFRNTTSNFKPVRIFVMPNFFLMSKEGDILYRPVKISGSPLDKAFIDSLSE